MPFYAVANGSQAVAGFLGLALFTRWLSPAQYGLYALTVTTATVVESVLFSWINNATLRYLPTSEHDARRIFLATSFMTTTALLLVVSVLWLLTATVMGGHSRPLAETLRVGLLVLVARVLFGFAIGLVRARRLTVRYAFYTAASAFGAVGLAAVLHAAAGIGTDGILYVLALSMGVPAVVELVRSGAFGWMRRSLFTLSVARRSAAYGGPLVGATFGALVLSVADRYMLEYFRGPSDVGAYSAGYDLADKSLKLIFTVLVASSLPVVMDVLARRGAAEANRLINRTIRAYLVWMVPLTTAFIGLRREIADVVLGPSFAQAATVMPWVAVGTLCWGATQVVAQAFQVQERTAPLLYWLLAAAALNLGLNVWAIPVFGLLGAAVATTVSYAAYLTALWLRRVREPELSFTGRQMVPMLAAGAAMYGAMSLPLLMSAPLMVSVALRLSLGLIAYGLALRLLDSCALEEALGDMKKLIRLLRSPFTSAQRPS